MLYRVSKQYAREGPGRALNRKKRETPPVPAKVTGEIEAKIIAVSCGGPPAGYSRWTLRLPEEKSKAVPGIELSDTTIRKVLKKNTPEAASEGMPARGAEGKRGVCGQYGGRS
ncbi:MAG: helix-turn-helix domain-containing protein [Spirochaetaceae bacterium]|nr:helix-turn-helix domain-containing protein [Spirochaetaceae bacterium]